MKKHVRDRTQENLSRVKNLIKIYEQAKNDKGELNTDVLRSAVVLLHATLEECLRSISYSKLPSASADELKKIPHKISISKVAEYRDKTIDRLLRDSLSEHLGRATYNNKDDISRALKSLSISTSGLDLVSLETAIKRRHSIVHRADRSNVDGGHGPISSIQAAHVERWVEHVEKFVQLVFDEL